MCKHVWLLNSIKAEHTRLLPNQTSKEKTPPLQKGQLIDCLPSYLLHFLCHLTCNLFRSLEPVLPVHSTSIHSFPLLRACVSINSLLHTQAHERTHTRPPTHTTIPALLPPQPVEARVAEVWQKQHLSPL